MIPKKKSIYKNSYFYLLTLTLFIFIVSKDYGFLALDLMYFDIIQWLIFALGTLFLSFGVSYILFSLVMKFPAKLRSIKNKEIISSS